MPGRGSVNVQSRFFAAPDGLSLHVRCYEPEGALRLPVLCLPGLTRNEADFEPLARYLSADSDRPRRVYALDSRGRGRSAYDPDWRNYNPAIELADVMAVAAAHSDPQAVNDHLAYLVKRVDQMAYPPFQAAGWPIGSGIVESANKLVVEARLKGAGMY